MCIRDSPHIGDIRGRGLLLGLEFVIDKASKTPFPTEATFHERLKNAAMDKGLICYPMSGTIDGHNGNHVLLAPPYTLVDQQLEEIVDKLEAAIDITVSSTAHF